MTQAVDRDKQAPVVSAGRGGLLDRLWRRRALAAAVWGCCVIGGFAYLLLAPAVYESIATLSAAAPHSGSAPVGVDALLNQADVIRSADVLSDAVAQGGLADTATLRGKGDPVEYLMRTLDVTVQSGALQIQVGMPAASAEDSANITNFVVGAFLARQNRAQSTQPAGPGTNVSDLDADRAKALQAFEEFKKENPEFITTDSADALGKRMAKLNDDLANAQSDAAAARAEFDAAKPKLADPQTTSQLVRLARSKNIFGPLDGQSDDIDNQIGDLEKTLAQQRQTMGDQNPVVRKTQQQIDALKIRGLQIDEQRGLILATYLQHQVDLATARIKETQAQLDSSETDARDYQTKAIEYHRLQQAAHTSESTAQQALTGVTATLRLSDAPHPQPTPIWPRPVPVLAFALIGGLILGVIAGTVRW